MIARYINAQYKVSIAKACHLSSLARANYYRQKQRKPVDDEIASTLKDLASRHKRWGCDMMVAYL